MLNIVIPMAGRGSRLTQAGYRLPKPLIPVRGIPMIQLVIENLRPTRPCQFTFLCLQEHIEAHQIDQFLLKLEPTAQIVSIETVTEGAACTVLLARHLIDNDQPLMIANSDQWVDVDIDDYLAAMARGGYDGYIMTMWTNDPKCSYVRLNEQNGIIEVVEKQVVSNEATVGIYNYARGRDFVKAALAMITADLRVNGEFYVAPAYNQMLANGARLGFYNVGHEYIGMCGLGIPSDLDRFEAMPSQERPVGSAARI